MGNGPLKKKKNHQVCDRTSTGNDGEEDLTFRGADIKRVGRFRYLGSIADEPGNVDQNSSGLAKLKRGHGENPFDLKEKRIRLWQDQR